MTTVRELIEGLEELALTLPERMDTSIEVGICDGENLQILDKVDVSEWTRVGPSGSGEERFILLRGHDHPGEESGEQLRGVTADADDELRKLTEEP